MRLGIFILLIIGFVACGDDERDCPDIKAISGATCDKKDTNWVCGCNDSTFINSCIANKAGYYVKHDGPCLENEE